MIGKIFYVIAVSGFLSGCATTQPAPVAVDTFCLTAKKRIWSIEDSPETIRAADVWNRTIDIRCGIPEKPA